MRISGLWLGSWRLVGTFALGLGLLVLGVLGLMTLGLALPAGSAVAHDHDHLEGDGSWSEHGRREGQPFHWSGRVARGKTVDVSGINGGIKVQLTRGSQVVVDARKSGRRTDPESVPVEATEQDGNVTICARYPGPDGRLNECGNRQNVQNNDVAVEFDVKIPAGVNLIVSTVNGAIEAEGLQGDVEATTVNGSVTVSTTGIASAQTVNGSVIATLGRLDENLEFRTVNGRVRVVLPGNVDAAVNARTMHGRISTDFPLSVKGRWGNRRMIGTIGRGGPQVRLETMNGQIELISAEGRMVTRDWDLNSDDDDDDDDEDEDDAEDEDEDDDDPR